MPGSQSCGPSLQEHVEETQRRVSAKIEIAIGIGIEIGSGKVMLLTIAIAISIPIAIIELSFHQTES